MDAVCKVLFHKLGFHGNSEMYYISENSFIDHVLEHKRGIPITLAIVFESVARRLGIRCEPVTFPSHFLLRWKERYTTPDAKDAENFYIDLFNGGQLLTKKNCPRIGGVSKCPVERYNVHAAATAVEVISKMAKNLELATRQHTDLNGRVVRLRSALKLMHMVQPYDTNTIMQLGQIYGLLRMDPTDIVLMSQSIQKDVDLTSRRQVNFISLLLQKFQERMQAKKHIEPKKRTPEVRYAVGLIMRHKMFGYLCVITGWDLRHKESVEIRADILSEGDEQPFYDVFGDDDSSRYVAQENLLLEPTPSCINHFEIGRYFCTFNGTYYVPNEEKAREYPEDAQVRDSIVANISQ
ncbi:hypothetical protein KM043_015222 [Ampulex compressa]|nr:hypothetical protein KM043_015222 [Ampulex compressa]